MLFINSVIESMRIEVYTSSCYYTGVHPEVTAIEFHRDKTGNFFEDDRFPNLVTLNCSYCWIMNLELSVASLKRLYCRSSQPTRLELNCPSLQELDCYDNRLEKLKLNCPSLQKLYCGNNRLTKLELNCSSLQELWCYNNQLTKLELICPSLHTLACHTNPLTDLNGIEFCADLKRLHCSPAQRESAEILKIHFPDLVVDNQ